MGNRLANSRSPYLRQHADNPVEWFAWGDEAFELARSSDRPIFLSIGYSSCHWCHVMAHESFEDAATASLMNAGFVNVKVDREELPHVDEAYVTFVQLLTGRGGWPTSVFLTPERAPFFGGTYWPRETFVSICERVADAWQNHRSELEDAAAQYSGALREAMSATDTAEAIEADNVHLVQDAVEGLGRRFDRVRGGFGTAPKFPPHSELELLLTIGDRDARHMAFFTLEKMALGGIFDQVGGGFHRYSTDADWLVPHFEKMLYDNALLLSRYAVAAERTGSDLFKRVVDKTVEWLRREMTSPEGLFYSALDADSEGEEGKFYVWGWDELQRVPRAEDFCRAYQCKPAGNFRDEATGRLTGANILHLRGDDGGNFQSQLDMLLATRGQRVRPGLDDKCLVGWNGLAIAGLVGAGEIEMAEKAARAILAAEKEVAELPHMIVEGEAIGHGFLEDYAYFAYALSLMGPEWTADARRIADAMIDRFADPLNGGFFSTEEGIALFARSKPVLDQPIPSANALAIRTLSNLGWHAQAKFHLDRLKEWTVRAPNGTEALVTTWLKMGSVGGPVSGSISDRVLTLNIEDGFHINGNAISNPVLIPTQLSFNGGRGEARFPVGEQLEGSVRIPLSFENGPVFVRFQACTQTECLAASDLIVH